VVAVQLWLFLSPFPTEVPTYWGQKLCFKKHEDYIIHSRRGWTPICWRIQEFRKQAISNSITNVLWRFLSIEATMFSPDHIQLRAELPNNTNPCWNLPSIHDHGNKFWPQRRRILCSTGSPEKRNYPQKNRQEARDQITWIRVSRGSKSANCPRGSDDLGKEQKKKRRLGVFLRGTGEKRKKVFVRFGRSKCAWASARGIYSRRNILHLSPYVISLLYLRSHVCSDHTSSDHHHTIFIL
jgi:hypothetical protein